MCTDSLCHQISDPVKYNIAVELENVIGWAIGLSCTISNFSTIHDDVDVEGLGGTGHFLNGLGP